jgi:hypothetical protein
LYNNLDSSGEYSLGNGQLKKEEIEGVLLTPLHILQMRVFIEAFTSEQRWMTIKRKKFTPQLAIDTDFFHSAFIKPCTM